MLGRGLWSTRSTERPTKTLSWHWGWEALSQQGREHLDCLEAALLPNLPFWGSAGGLQSRKMEVEVSWNKDKVSTS